ncbi:unnamed protein product [Schistosoma margrebowiei]|uniref:Uncharacterized protein n=1 Tax=Schistosoma margrebowiei TaxID=48269 RepID=A0A183LIP8_9TREM|nr:unnamed protein product [Schistosoma margrebowiei]
MCDIGWTNQIAAEMKRYNLTVIAISETHWTQTGEKSLDLREMLMYSDHQEKDTSHTHIVAHVLSKKAHKALIGWESHGSRNIKASFKTKKEGTTMIVIKCYTSSSDCNNDDKDQFYERLQSIIAKCSGKDLTILIADLNAKIVKILTSEGKHEIQWTAEIQQEYLNLVHGLAILSHTHEQMQVKTVSVGAVSAAVDLNIQKDKSKILKYNMGNTNPVTLGRGALGEVEPFTKLDNIIDEQGESDADVKSGIGKTMTAFPQLRNIWDSKQLSASQYQSQDIQYERQDNSTIWS